MWVLIQEPRAGRWKSQFFHLKSVLDSFGRRGNQKLWVWGGLMGFACRILNSNWEGGEWYWGLIFSLFSHRTSMIEVKNLFAAYYYVQGLGKDSSVSKKHASITIGENIQGGKPEVGLSCLCMIPYCNITIIWVLNNWNIFNFNKTGCARGHWFKVWNLSQRWNSNWVTKACWVCLWQSEFYWLLL